MLLMFMKTVMTTFILIDLGELPEFRQEFSFIFGLVRV